MEIRSNIPSLIRLSDDWFCLPAPFAFWDEAQVEGFLSRWNASFDERKTFAEQRRALVASIVCWRMPSGELHVVRGAQALACAWLIGCVCRNLLGATPDAAFPMGSEDTREHQLRYLRALLGGFHQGEFRQRARLRCEDAQVQSQIDDIYHDRADAASPDALFAAYRAIERHLSGYSAASAISWIAHILTHIEFLLLVCDERERAEDIASLCGETATRAAPTSLRELLLACANPADAPQIDMQLERMDAQLQGLGEVGDAFLGDVLTARYAPARISPQDALAWLDGPEGRPLYQDDPLGFATVVCAHAERYACFYHATQSDVEMQPYPDLTYIGYAGTKAFRQHLPLLMACDDRLAGNAGYFKLLCRNIESIVFIHFVSGLSPTARGDRWAEWTRRLRDVHAPDQLREFLRDTLAAEAEQCRSSFEAGFLSLTLSSMDDARQLYLFSRIENHMRVLASLPPVPIDRYRQLQMEDILTKQPEALPIGFGTYEEYMRATQQLANRTLLEPSLPIAQVEHAAYDVKRQVYARSKVLLTSKLVMPYERFAAEDVADRQRRLFELAQRIWSVSYE